MGSVGSVNSNSSGSFNRLPDTNIKPLKPTSRANEVFNREYTQLRLLADRLIADGEYNSGGYSTLHNSDDEPVFSRRMLQGMQARLNSEWHGLEIDVKLGVGTPEERRKKRYALIMLQKMLNKYYKSMY